MVWAAAAHRETSRTEPGVPAGAGKRWAPVWEMSDEFWREELHDIWEPFNRSWSGRHPSFFDPANVRVKNHALKLWAREAEAPPALAARGHSSFSTAFVRSKRRQLYGYFEIFAKPMDSRISSAFWLAHNEPQGEGIDDSWWTEIDVFEYSTSTKNNVNQARRLNTNLHVHRNGKWPQTPHISRPESFDLDADLSREPHVFALDWSPDYIAWYLDGKPIRKVPNHYHHRPLHLQFDCETFPQWFGLPETGGSHKNKLPNAFEIYYVRTWQREDI